MRTVAYARHAGFAAGGLIALTLIALCALIVALSDPKTGTPLIRSTLHAFVSREANLESGWLSLKHGPILRLQGLDIPQKAQAANMNAQLAPFSFLSGDRVVPVLSVTDGEIRLAANGPAQAGGNPLANIDRVDLHNVRVVYTRGRDRVFVIDKATGSLRDGTVVLDGRGGATNVHFEGRGDLTAGDALGGTIALKGDNAARFADLLGLAAPDTPPFNVTGALQLASGEWHFNEIKGRVGDSDIRGRIDVDPRRAGRPYIDAQLRSKRLDFDDLGIIVGAPTQTGKGETVSQDQAAANANYRASSRLLPNAQLDFERLSAVNGKLNFRADSVRAGGLPLSGVDIKLTLQDRVLTFDPLTFEAPQGALTGHIVIDARNDPAKVTAKGMVRGFQLAQIAQGHIARGELRGGFNVAMQGSDLRTAFASTDGDVALWANNAQVRTLAVRGADLDVARLLWLLLTEDKANPKMQSVNCLATRIVFKNGEGTLAPAVLDTKDSVVTAKGRVNFNNEVLSIKVDGDSKKLSWGTLLGNIQVKGTMREPKFGFGLGKTGTQAAIGGALATIAPPLAALPFFDLGGAEDAPCASLLARAKGEQAAQAPPAN